MSNRRLMTLAIAALVLVPAVSGAQRGAGRRQQPPLGGGRGGAMPAERIGEALAEVMQLTDQQRPRFAEVNRKFSDRERVLNEEERVARTTMRNLLCSGDTTRGGELSKSLDQVLDIQKRRHQMIEDQQKELSTFLTPYQRARFLGGRELLMERLGRGGGRGAGRQGGPPPQGGDQPPRDGPPQARMQGGGLPRDICAQPPMDGPQIRRGR